MINIQWTKFEQLKIYCHFYFRGVTLSVAEKRDLSSFLRARFVRFFLVRLRVACVIKKIQRQTQILERSCAFDRLEKKNNFFREIWACVVPKPPKKQEHHQRDTMLQLIARRVSFQLKTDANSIPRWRAVLKKHVHALKKRWRQRVW